MKEWRLIRYDVSRRAEWDAFVDGARNATFLFRRDYMDYHADRFKDCSWMAYKGDKLRAMLPANIDEQGVLHSHQGLTYGGWILPFDHMTGADLEELFEVALKVWREMGITELDYKPIPTIYCAVPSQEELFLLYRYGAVMTNCGLSSAVDLERPIKFNKLQRRHLAAAGKLSWSICEEESVGRFMAMLEHCLAERHGAKPVHTSEELQMLRDLFPMNIRVFTISLEGEEPAAGVCIYDTGITAHCQYIATTQRGRDLNLLTPLFYRLMTEEFATRRYFDFGISNEPADGSLNVGLHRQKSSYGATGVAHLRFRLSL